jgi:4-hydroxy-tetrahydrodipicolinate synthase
VLTAEKLRGIVPAMVTPFTPDDEVDVEGLKKLTENLIECGIHGIMTTGGNGEFPHLLPDERRKVLEVVLDETNGRVPVIACTTACSTRETILYTKHARDTGADAAIVVQPYYYKLPDAQIFEYYQRIAAETDLPIVVYNNPGYTGNAIPPSLMVRILTLDGVIGLKQSEYDISQTLEIIRQVGYKVSIMTGIDSQVFPILCIGGRGGSANGGTL